MLLLEILSWAWEHKGEITLNGILLLILRKFIITEIHKTIHFGREEEVEWILSKVEHLTGETFSHQPILKQVQTRYIKRFYLYLRKVIQSVNQLRRNMKMNQNINWVTLGISLLGVLKLVLQPLGFDFSHITDQQVNDIANGVATIVSIWGVIKSHQKTPDPQQPKSQNFIQG